MKGLLIGIACVIAFVAVVAVGGAWWFATHKFDMTDPNVARGFKKNFVRNCVAGVEKRVEAAGKIVGPNDDEKFTQLCSCMADDTLARADRNGGLRLSDFAVHRDQFVQQMQESGRVCTAKLGLRFNG